MPAAPSDPTPPGGATPMDRASPTGPTDPRRPRSASDGARYAISAGVAVVAAAAYGALAPPGGARGVGSLAFVATAYFVAWSVYALVFVAVTWSVLRRADGEHLAAWLTENRSQRRRRRRTEWLAGSAGPLGAVSFCTTAIGAVVCAAVVPELRDDPVVIGLAVVVVTATWLLITVLYAVHYARENIRHGGLEFHGVARDGPPRLVDHLYLAVQVATAYNGADVTVTSRAMRQTVTVHAVVAFVFNSVLIALLVSLLLGATD